MQTLFRSVNVFCLQEEEDEEEGKKKEEPVPYVESVSCYTEVFTKCSGIDLRSRLLEVVESVEGLVYNHKRGRFEMRITLPTALGPVTASAQILALPDKTMHVLRFRRLNGDATVFRSFFVQVADLLQDLAYPPPVALAPPPPAAFPSVDVSAGK